MAYKDFGSSDWWQSNMPPGTYQNMMPGGGGAMGAAARQAAQQAGQQQTGGGQQQTGAGGTGQQSQADVLEQLKKIMGNDWSTEHIKAVLPDLLKLGIHVQNEARGDYRPRFLLPNGETWDYGPGGWVGRGNMGDWHSGSTSNKGSGGGGGTDDRQKFLEDTPGYQFTLAEGLKGVQRSAAAKGTLLTGGTMKALMQYGSGLASKTYGDEIQRRIDAARVGAGGGGQQ